MALELFKTPLAADANLKGYWRLEADGTDSSGNGKNMSPTGSPSYVAGMFGNGVKARDGQTDYLSVADDLGIQGGAISISFWLKLSADISSGASNFCQQNDAGTVTGNCVSYEYNGGTRRLYFRRSKWNVAHQGPYYNIALGTGQRHIVYTYDGTYVSGYVDGELVAGPTAASGNGTGVMADGFATSSLFAGGDSISDDISVFNRVLTAAEVLSIYSGAGWPATTNQLTNYRPRKRSGGAVSV